MPTSGSKQKRVSRKGLRVPLSLLAIGGLLLGCDAPNPGAAKTPDPIATINVRFPIPAVRPSMGPFFVAQDKGWYAAENLKVDFHYGGESTNPVAMVLAGTDDVGVIGGPDTVLVAVGKGAPLVILAVIHKDSNMPCIITRKDSGITNIGELDGKRVGMFPGHISTDVLHAWFRKAGIAVNEVDVGYDYSQFLSSKVDGQWAFTTAAAVELPEKGIPVNVLSPSDSGIFTHGFTIFATTDFVSRHPDRVKGFLSATFKGIREMKAAPEEVAAIVTTRDTTGNLKQAQVRRRIDQYNAFSPAYDPLPPGYFDKAMLQDTYERLYQEGVIENAFDIEKAYTTEFLSSIHGSQYAP